jgi:hypothetical protein
MFFAGPSNWRVRWPWCRVSYRWRPYGHPPTWPWHQHSQSR